MSEINSGRERGTWCGFPHHLLLPRLVSFNLQVLNIFLSRSKDYDPTDKNLGGQNFVLYAFVTNTDNDVTAGSDGVEHM